MQSNIVLEHQISDTDAARDIGREPWGGRSKTVKYAFSHFVILCYIPTLTDHRNVMANIIWKMKKHC